MRDSWKIARWEIMRNIANKQFIISLLLTPLIFVVFAALPTLLERWNQPEPIKYNVVDEIGALPNIQAVLPDNIIVEVSPNVEAAATIVDEQKAAGYLILDRNFIQTGTVELVYDECHNDAMALIEAGLTSFLQQERLYYTNMDPEQLAYVTASANLIPVSLDAEDSQGLDVGPIMVSVIFIIVIYFMIFASGTMLLQSALQERRDRMAEVILSSINASSLMQGKIIGHFFLAIIQLCFWALLAIPAVIYFLDFPLWEAISQTNTPLLLFFGLFGYLMYAALFVGLGATMEDLQSAGNSQGIVIMLPMLAFIFIGPVISNPDGTIAQFASYLPFSSPLIMVIRNAFTQVPWWQILISGALLLITTLILTRLAAKIFRVGMLMYGKNATPREILRWLTYKEN